jgi:hypothetical protein
VTITDPSGGTFNATLRANKIGWVYDPTFDFLAFESGRWTVDVTVVHDQPYPGNGVTPLSHNTGTVLGTSGQYEFYVVEPGAPRLFLYTPTPGFLNWPQGYVTPVPIFGAAPPGTTQVFYTIHDKGIVMGQGVLTPDSQGVFSMDYDADLLNTMFPMLSLTAREGRWPGLADEVAINFLALTPAGPRAATLTLIGEEVFVQGTGPSPEQLFLPGILR